MSRNTVYSGSYGQLAMDPDAAAFIAATGITDATVETAINILVQGLKTQSIWSKMTGFYPLVGETDHSVKFNLVNPADSDGAFRLTFFDDNGAWTFDKGLRTYAIGYVSTNIVPSADLIDGDTHLSYKCTQGISGGIADMGSRTSGNLALYNYANTYYADMYTQNTGRLSSYDTDSTGVIIGTRNNTEVPSQYLYRNGVQLASNNYQSGGTIASIDPPVLLTAIHDGWRPNYRSQRKYTFFTIGQYLTPAQCVSLTDLMDNFDAALGR